MIEIKNLNCKIGNKSILENINLSIAKNEIVVLIGKNGSGKSSLIKAILSINKHSGQVLVDDINISKLKNKNRARIVSYLPQNCTRTNIKVATLVKHGRFPHLDFGQDLSENDYEIINEAVTLTGITPLLNKNIMEISGGERQLAYLTMVLAQQTPVVLLDEPNTFLDISHQIFLFDIIKKLKENGNTLIIVLHDIIKALEIADKIVVIDNGKIIDYGPPSTVKGTIETIFDVGICETELLNDEKFEPLYRYSLVKKR